MDLHPRPVWISNERCRIGENPLWDGESSSLYWMNIADPLVYRWRDDRVETWTCPKPIGSIFLAGPERLLVAMRPALAWLDLQVDGSLRPIATDVQLHPDERYNDGRCDAEGRLWISTLDRKVKEGIGSLVHYDAGFVGTRLPTEAIIGNGLCFSPEGKFLYFSDSRGRSIYRYPKQGGTVGPRERLVELDADPGRPDGCSVDAEGCLWSARIGGGRIDRYRPDGALVDSLVLPVANPTHCAFGGPGLKTLFVTTARFDEEPSGSDAGLAGAVLAYDVDVAGQPEPSLGIDYMGAIC